MAFCQTFRLSVSLLYFWRLRCILLSKTPSKPDVQIWELLRNQDLLLLWQLRESEWLARTKSLHWCQDIQKMSGGVNNCSDQHIGVRGGVNSRSTPPGGHFLTPTPVEHFGTPPGQQVVPGLKAPYKSPIQMKWFFLACGGLRLYTVLGSILMTIFIFLVTIIQKTGPTPPLSYFTAQHLPPLQSWSRPAKC